jgi:small-conductance mechanosensitive channel
LISIIALLAVVGAIGIAAIGVVIARRLVHRHVAEGHNDVLVPIFLTAGTIYAVFLAFLVVAVWESYDAAHDNAAEEASTLATLYRASTGMEKTSGDQMRILIRDYTEAVVKDEWSIQARTGGASPKARTAALGMYRLFGQLPANVRQSDAVIDQGALQLVSQVQTDRNRRTLQAGESLPLIMWIASVGSGVLVMGLALFLYMDRPGPQIIATGLLAALFAMLLAITFVLSRPFVGPMALQPDAFEHSLTVYNSVDKTP